LYVLRLVIRSGEGNRGQSRPTEYLRLPATPSLGLLENSSTLSATETRVLVDSVTAAALGVILLASIPMTEVSGRLQETWRYGEREEGNLFESSPDDHVEAQWYL
jgi:hypothetical protein